MDEWTALLSQPLHCACGQGMDNEQSVALSLTTGRAAGNPPKKPPGSKVENSRNMTRGGSICANPSLLTARSWRS